MPSESPTQPADDPTQQQAPDDRNLTSQRVVVGGKAWKGDYAPDASSLKSSAVPDEPGGDRTAEQRTEPPPAGPQPVLLTRHGSTRINIVLTSTPWALETDAFVIPVGRRAGLNGGLAKAWLSLLGDENTANFRAAVKQAMGEQQLTAITPDAPLLVPLSADMRSQAQARYAILATAYTSENSGAEVASAKLAARAVLRLAASNRLGRVAVALLGSGVGGLASEDVVRAMLRGMLETPRQPRLAEVTLTTLNEAAITAAQEAVREMLGQRIQDLSNDLARGEDLLSIEGEVSALAEGLLLRDLNPPLVVGVLGGWGSGKSFVMHLMHERMAELRSEPIPDSAPPANGDPGVAPPDPFPYVGHVYLIKFDAWTYAKSNLWASLMQTIFYELNQQLTLEKKLREMGVSDREGGTIWRILFDMDEKQRERWLADPLAGDVFREVQEDEATEDLLWSTLRDMKQAEREILHEMESQLAEKRQALEAARQALHQQVEAEMDKEARAKAWVPLQSALQDTLGASFQRFREVMTAPLFTSADLKDLASLERKLNQPTTLLDTHLRERLSQVTLDALKLSAAAGAPAESLPSALIADLNRIIQGRSIWAAERFQGIGLTDATRTLIEQKPEGPRRVRLNRWLLAEAYPVELTREPAEEAGQANAPLLHEVWPTLADLFRLVRRNWVEAAAFALFLGAIVAAPWFIDQVENYPYPRWLLAAGAFLFEAFRAQQKWRGLLTDSWAAYRQQVREARARLEAERPHRLQQALEAQTAEAHAVQDDEDKLQQLTSVPALELQVQKLEGQAKRQRQRVGLTADTVSLADFVSTRLNEAYYENQLGLMHQVQRDLRELAASLTAQPSDDDAGPVADEANAGATATDEQIRNARIRQALFPRGPARIVLFIDDLDRCPPDKVVQVLEATQLLVKTSLFVVILAMDVRFISRALEKEYANILIRKGKPSGLDYIEKIIQIPYQVRSVEADALPRYLEALMRPVADAKTGPTAEAGAAAGDGRGTGARARAGAGDASQVGAGKSAAGILPTRALTFSAEEHRFVQRCCQYVDLTPRAIKRLVNVYRLIKIIWARPNPIHQPAPAVEQAILVLLALAGRYPDQMRDVLEALQPEIETRSETSFVAFFENYEPLEADAHLQREWERLLADVQALMPAAPEPLKLGQMDMDNFDLVRSFSFVGDIGYQPGDFVAATPEREPLAEPPPSPSGRDDQPRRKQKSR